ncbi:MAG: TIGR01459 family HAD-type hydrolase [Xanthobacteraceae bacterium]|nr:TIGR01459 family HAD-type hydrolase [Xanthobacteraceae bacterium]
MNSALSFSDHFELLADRYDVLLCDVWGVVHNSIVAFPQAAEALARFRQRGGAVVLITNAPRPGTIVGHYLDKLGLPRSSYDAIMASGDVTRGVIARRQGSVYHLGPERDLPIFQGLDLQFAPPDRADFAVCTGLFNDDTETPDDYRDLLAVMRARDLFMLCANPDLVVERGEKLIYCAGALADVYAALGGEVFYAGKPYAPIYEEALAIAQAVRGTEIRSERVLAIGDSIRTDLKGARDFGLDCLFVTAGIHSEEFGGRDSPDLAALAEAFRNAGVMPTAITRRLAW